MTNFLNYTILVLRRQEKNLEDPTKKDRSKNENQQQTRMTASNKQIRYFILHLSVIQ